MQRENKKVYFNCDKNRGSSRKGTGVTLSAPRKTVLTSTVIGKMNVDITAAQLVELISMEENDGNLNLDVVFKRA